MDERLRAYAYPDHPLVNKFWPPLDDDRARALEQELRAELGPTHSLFGRELRALGAATTNDDVLLVALLDGAATLVEAHLTWGAHPESSPDFPACTIFAGLDELIARAAADYE